ncbi:MAG: carboxyl transferase domain-containing protein [Thermodesulfobacteriota bacterium]|nr:carboxyl transferase domain-containing protein [Thermodesulfobacteriota bacterium]
MQSRARQRIETLLDSGTFNETKPVPGRGATGHLTGSGEIDGRKVYVSAVVSEEVPLDVFDGYQHHLTLLEQALNNPAPVIMILDVPGHHKSATKSPFPQNPARLLVDKRGMGHWYSLHAQLSGRVPQLCVVCAKMGAALTFPVAMCDAVVMLDDAGMSIGRPDVVKKIIGEQVDYKKLGSAEMHAEISGSVDSVVKTEAEAFTFIRNYLAYFPSYTGGSLPVSETYLPPANAQSTVELIPDNPNVAFNMANVIESLTDGGTFMQLRQSFAAEVMTGFARIEGRITGILANNSLCQGGVFFPGSCRKATRFVSLCDAFGIPLVFLADSAGFMVGSAVEQEGIIREAALLFQTIATTTVAKLSVAVRRDYTAGVYAMAGPGMNPEHFIALPTAVISIYGQVVADKLSSENLNQQEIENRQEMLSGASNPDELHQQGLIDEIVYADDLRMRIGQFLINKQTGAMASGRSVLLV